MKKILIFCFCTFLCLNSSAQLSIDTAMQIDKLFAGRAADEPGGVLEIYRGGNKIYRKVFGVSNLEQPTAINSETVFHAASVSKQFTAAGILLLAEEGKLKLDDDVRKFLPEFPDFEERISIRQLLTHTSGLKDWWNVTYLSSWPVGNILVNQKMAFQNIIRQSNLNYTPGERYSYTNTGYDLAAIIIERVSGKTFAAYIQDNFLTPAGMTKSKIRGKSNEVIKNLATSYSTSSGNFVRGEILNETAGAAGLLTTASDLTKWNFFISKHKIAKLREERYVLNNKDTIAYSAGGIQVNFVNGIKELSHSGLEGGFRSLCIFYPDQGLSITYMSNLRDISTVDLHKNLSEIFFGKQAENTIFEKLLSNSNSEKKSRNKAGKTAEEIVNELNQKTGIFLNLNDESDFLKLHLNKGKLMRYAVELSPISADVFVNGSNIYHFQHNMDTVKLYSGKLINTYYRVAALMASEINLNDFAGNYYSKEADVHFNIKVENGRLIANHKVGESILLTPEFKLNNQYAFRGFNNGLRATYFFEKTGEKSYNLEVSLPRAYAIPFEQIDK